MDALHAAVRSFCAARGWDRYHTPRALAMGITTEAAELLQEFRFLGPDEQVALFDGPETAPAVYSDTADFFANTYPTVGLQELLEMVVKAVFALLTMKKPAFGCTLQIEGPHSIEYAERIGRATCDEAEYQAMIGGLSKALEIGVDEITVRGDSQLVVRQIRGEWRTNKQHLKLLRDEASELIGQFDTFEIEHISRVENSVADSLVERAFR